MCIDAKSPETARPTNCPIVRGTNVLVAQGLDDLLWLLGFAYLSVLRETIRVSVVRKIYSNFPSQKQGGVSPRQTHLSCYL